MGEFFDSFLDTSSFPPRWFCGQWSSLHGWIHIGSDLAIWAAYTSIPCALAYFVLRRKDVPFAPVFWLFAAFIFSCGATHLIEACLFWWPVYRLSAAMKIITAVVSWATVFALIRHTPAALELPGLAKLNAELVRLARSDELTGLSNRRHLLERLSEEVERARRHHRPLSFLLIDVDRFKRINDDYGHLTGDDALVQVAQLIQESCRAADLAGRYGGEEFGVVLPETDLAGARVLADRLRERVEAGSFQTRGGGQREFQVTCSVGVAQLSQVGQMDRLLARVDKALYKAKHEGRNRVVCAPEIDSWSGQKSLAAG
jgi:diguanylate cyclase (GGDEF)-like protein